MARSIMVDPAKLETAANKIDQQAADYERIYKQLFSEVDSMGAAWQGQDNIAFVTQIKGFMDDLQDMARAMRDYSSFLKTSATTYRNTQNEIINSARKLTN